MFLPFNGEQSFIDNSQSLEETINCRSQEMRDQFDEEAEETGQPALLLTAAVAAGKSKIDAGYDVRAIAR